MYYDSGFLIGLKAFVAAIIGGLVSYPGDGDRRARASACSRASPRSGAARSRT